MESISPAEWDILRIIWTEKRVTARHLIDLASQQHAWSASTVKTLLTRLRTKGLVRTLRPSPDSPYSSRAWIYEATISEGEAINNQASDLFANFCSRHQGPALIHLADSVPLSQENIRDLQAILARRAETAPHSIPCNCEDGCCPDPQKHLRPKNEK
jgi:CopY/TcrY family copper transport repressor